MVAPTQLAFGDRSGSKGFELKVRTPGTTTKGWWTRGTANAAGLAIWVAGLGCSPAFSQSETGVSNAPQTVAQHDNIAEIVVTAQKRSERLIDVPLSITAVTGQELARAGVTSPSDLGKVVPGFTFQPSNLGPPVFSIRGVGFFDNSIGATPTVTVYVDQVPLPYLSMVSGAALDLDRVEVLKGPQGTLFGQNSTGGAINFIAAKPTKDLKLGSSVEYARFDKVNVDGYLSGPLSDTLGARIAFRTEQGGAWQRSLSRPGDRLGDRNFSAGRLTLDWTPDDAANFVFAASGWVNKSDTQAAQYVGYSAASPNYTDLRTELLATAPAPRDNRYADWDPGSSPSSDSRFYQLSLRGDFDLSDAVSLVSITAYSNLDLDQAVDADGTQYNNILAFTDAAIEAFSQELRFEGTMEDVGLRWVLGGNYASDENKDSRSSNYRGSNNGIGPLRYNEYKITNNVDSEAVAVFGNLDYQATRTVSLQASARYTDQTRRGSSCLADTGAGDLAAVFSLLSTRPYQAGECVTFAASNNPGPPPFVPVGGFVKSDLVEDNVSWRGNISWKPNDDVHLYTNVTRGYKSGSFSNLPLVFSSQYQPVTQESVTAYEAGFKFSLLDRMLQLSGAGFYYDYKDKQILGTVFTSLGILPGLVSVPKSHITGAELNATLRPTQGLTLNAGATWIDTKVRSNFVTLDPLGNNIDVRGYRFPITPQWQLSSDVGYEFPLSGSLSAFVGGSVNYRSSTPATFGGGSEFTLPAYTLVDLRAGVDVGDGRYRVELWGRNIFDEFYTVNAMKVIDTIARVTGQPATYGVRFSANF